MISDSSNSNNQSSTFGNNLKNFIDEKNSLIKSLESNLNSLKQHNQVLNIIFLIKIYFFNFLILGNDRIE